MNLSADAQRMKMGREATNAKEEAIKANKRAKRAQEKEYPKLIQGG